jgi:DNA repair protein RadA
LEIVDAEVGLKLRAGGFADVKSIENATVAEIHEAIGLSMEKSARLGLDKLQTSDSGFVSASQLYKKRKGQGKISTGCMALDDFGGGMETSAITEVYGQFSTGMSRLCFIFSLIV